MKSNSDKYSGIYKELVDLLGEEDTLKIYESFRGQQVTFPMRRYSKKYIKEYIIENYNGRNIKQLSKELGYTCNWIQQLINKLDIRKSNDNIEYKSIIDSIENQ